MYTEEQIKAKIRFAGTKKPSMDRRKQGHDYRSVNMYMITMHTEGWLRLFGTLEGDVRQPFGADDAPHIALSKLGQAIAHNFFNLAVFHEEITVIMLQMMPEHFHGILFVKKEMDIVLGKALNSFKAGCRKAFRNLCPEVYEAEKRQQTQLSRWRKDKEHGILFALGYNDKILIRAGQLATWERYLLDNPRRRMVKEQHPEFFRVLREITWKGMTFSAIGNLFLLRHPQLLQVQCSRRMTAEDIEAEKTRFLCLCSKGAVLVSPRISPGEKAIIDAAFDAGYPVIIIKDNGFVPLEKPHGRAFDACAAGRLLLLGPTHHSNERQHVTRSICLSMNDIARKICESEQPEEP